MDPVSALVLAFTVATLLTRNTVQDIVYKSRGEDPPYLVRRRERAAKRGVPLSERGAAWRFFASAWEDAWEDAQEKRQRTHDKKREQRRQGWAERDAIDAVEDEAWEANREHDRAQADRDERHREAWKSIPDHCEACRKPVTKEQITIATVDGDLRWVCPDCAQPMSAAPDPVVHDNSPYVLNDGEADSEQPPPHLVDFVQHSTCRDCGGQLRLEKDPERPGRWIVRTTHVREDCPQDPQRPRAEGQQTEPEQEPGDTAGATVTPIDAWRHTAASTTNTPEETVSVSGETTNLAAALAYTSQMASSNTQAAASAETSIASLKAGKVAGEALTHLEHAQELQEQAAAAFEAAKAALTRQIQVREAYQANSDAGDKQFLTQD